MNGDRNMVQNKTGELPMGQAEPERKKRTRTTKVRRNYVAECAELQRRIDIAKALLGLVTDIPIAAEALRQLQGKVNLAATGENA